MGDGWVVLEDDELRVTYPQEWRAVTRMRDCRLMLLTPGSAAEFRSSVTITDEPVSESGLSDVVEGLLPEMDRYLTDYAANEVLDVEIDARPAKLVLATYRHGRAVIRLNQWFVQTRHRLVSISASHDRDLEPDFFRVASEVVDKIRFVEGDASG